jgi:hypothetical protein
LQPLHFDNCICLQHLSSLFHPSFIVPFLYRDI